MSEQDTFLTDKIEQSWKEALAAEFDKPYFADLTKFVREEYQSGRAIYPAEKHIFAAFELCPLDTVKVVIIGQDPYYNPGQAHGLCFSVQNNDIPGSLENIYKEIESDLGRPSKTNGDLTAWARQGVLLLNSILTVGTEPKSHAGKGWETFTDAAIRALSLKKNNLVYMLWGESAREKEAAIENPDDNLVLKAAHPSGQSAYKGFFNSGHFAYANDYLHKHGKTPVEW